MQLKIDRCWVIVDEDGDIDFDTSNVTSRDECIREFISHYKGSKDLTGNFWKELVCSGYTCVEVAIAILPAGAEEVKMSVVGFGNPDQIYEYGKL